MKGLELSKRFFEENRHVFEGFYEKCAFGLFGPGSECLGFDDEISRDHDFSADFMVLISEEDDHIMGVPLARAYNSLPKEFLGVKRAERSALGFSKGVTTLEGFFRSVTGRPYGPESIYDWLYTPSYALANASDGEVFFDGTGRLTAVREHILNGMPEDVRRKKLAACAAAMAQSGQYNYSRCIKHGERGAACLALNEFVLKTAQMIYLLNKKHMPFYKWCFKGMEGLKWLCGLKVPLEELALNPADAEERIEAVCADIAGELRRQGLSDSRSDYLEAHGFVIMRSIENHDLRNMHIMEG